jgi:tetratricopeptide (TPR) repeat protein
VTAFQIDSRNPGNAYELALAYLGNGELERAREQGRKMLSNAGSAEAHRLVGDLDERLGDPLGAVRQYEQATRLDSSEQNYFQWGTELLMHRAAQPAAEVFSKGFSAHPESARLLTGLGVALFASSSYDDAARRLCDASDLRPTDPAPYLFLGRMEKAAPEALPCSEEKLARFVAEQPANAFANYYYGLILRKRAKGSENPAGLARAKTFLEKAVSLDPKLGEAHLQLGILQAESGDFVRAVGAYQKAIEVSPQLGEAHYRLSLAYERMGEEAKAEQEMQTYKQIEKAEADELEREQRERRQFLIILEDPPADAVPY